MANMSFGLEQGLGQSQKLTPQMQQAIKLLQLSALELEQEIQAKLDSNPLLERADEDDCTDSLTLEIDTWTNQATGFDGKATSADAEFGRDNDRFDKDAFDKDSFDKIDATTLDDDAMDMHWQEVYGDDVDSFGIDSFNSSSAPAEDGSRPLEATQASIQDHVRWQMNFKPLSDLDKLIAEYLIDAMDDLGFVRIDPVDVAKHFTTVLNFYELEASIDAAEVLAVLHMIQSCSPTGVGAQDLSQCLQLQLKELPNDTPHWQAAMAILVHSELLKEGNIKALLSKTKLSEDQLQGAIALIRTLSPNPAQQFLTAAGHSDEPDIPDILVLAKARKSGKSKGDPDGWQVALNPAILPKLQINQNYANLVKRGDDSTDNQYLKQQLQDARLFIRSIEERNQNLLKVATFLVQKQQDFLLYGATAIHPLTLKEVADAIGVHESTVSRLTTNKSMLTPQGLHPLKYFFSSHVQGDLGNISSTAVSAAIKKLIDGENPKKPLSDNKITQLLSEQGIDIARRTVTKYREALGIAASPERKARF